MIFSYSYLMYLSFFNGVFISHFSLIITLSFDSVFFIAVSVLWFQSNNDYKSKKMSLIFRIAIRGDTMEQSANMYYSALLKTVITLFTLCMFSSAAPHFWINTVSL